MREWTADADGLVTSIEVDGAVARVVPPVQAKAGRVFLVKPSDEPGVVMLKRRWVTPEVIEHTDRLIATGSTGGTETSGSSGSAFQS